MKLIFILLFASILSSSFLQSAVDDSDYILDSKCATFQPDNHYIVSKRNLAEVTEFDRPILQKTQSSKSGRFLIHFDISGKNSVNLEDSNNNGVPDYVDSVCYYFDYVHNIEVNQMGYLTPASDNGLGGSDAFDVYLLDIGNGDINNPGLYGYTVPEVELEGGLPSRIRYSAYIVTDNDFSETDSSYKSNGEKYRTFSDTSFLGMKITAAHEYHHAVQFMYGEDVTAPSLNEMTSTWFEYRLFPETRDYLQYVRYLFKNPGSYNFGNGNAVTGYLYSIYGQYLHKYFGDELLLRMWQMIGEGIQSYEALDRSLTEKKTNMENEWCSFMNWLYYTNERSNGEGFEHADEFPLITYYRNELFTQPGFTSSSELLSYEFRFYRITLEQGDINTSSDIFDIAIVNTDLRSAVFQSQTGMPYLLSVIDESKPDYTRIGDLDYFYRVEKSKGNICDKPYVSEGEITNSICYAYPNPFKDYKDNILYFPAPHNSKIGTEAELLLLDTQLNEVYEGNLSVVINNGKRVIEFSPNSYSISSGIYIFKVSNGSTQCSGKIAIIKSN